MFKVTPLEITFYDLKERKSFDEGKNYNIPNFDT